MGYCEKGSEMWRYTKGISFAAGLQRIFAANSLRICCSLNGELEGFRYGWRGFAAKFPADCSEKPGQSGFPDTNEGQAAAWNRPFHSPPRPRQKRIAEATVAAV